MSKKDKSDSNNKKPIPKKERGSNPQLCATIGDDYFKKFEKIRKRKNCSELEFLRHIVQDYLNFHYAREKFGELYFPTELLKILYAQLSTEKIQDYARQIAELTDTKFKKRKRNPETLVQFLGTYFKDKSNHVEYSEQEDELIFTSNISAEWTNITTQAIGKTLEKFGYQIIFPKLDKSKTTGGEFVTKSGDSYSAIITNIKKNN